MKLTNWFKNIGPGPLVAAAFIGPGTVTVCTLAGVHFGYALLWALAFSVIATIILQEMTARLGIVTQKGLSDVIRTEIKNTWLKKFMITLILIAIVIGNAAYEGGNISGGILGMESLFGSLRWDFWGISLNGYSLFIGCTAFSLLYFGNYRVLEKVLLGMVILMSIAFLMTAILSRPNLMEILKGIFTFQSPEGSLLTIIALIGTTVVPYNLFPHASLVTEKWKTRSHLKHAKKDTFIAMVLGGIVSMCIMIAATSIQTKDVSSASDLAEGLAPLFGSFSKYVMSIGLFAAGLTSAITAPLAAAYVATGCLGRSVHRKSPIFRFTWVVILVLGVVFASTGIKPINIIQIAQVANGLLLPIIACFLLWVMNRDSLLKSYKNSWVQNILGILVVLTTVFLGLKSIASVLNLL